MKIFFRILLLALLSLISGSAKADLDFAGLVGYRMNTGRTNILGATGSSKFGFMAGFVGWIPLRHGIGVRTGALYNQRYMGLGPVNEGDIDIQYSYLDLPMTAMYQMNSQWTIYGGPTLAFNQSKDVSCTKLATCSAADVKSFLLPWQFGVDFKFAPQFGGEFFFETINGDLSTNVSDMKAVGLSLLVFFD